MADYFIGDIHGCFAELMQLVDELNLDTSDNLYFAGDLVNRGPESLETLRWVKDNNGKVVLGNHDLYLLACHFEAIPSSYTHTFHRVVASEECAEIMEWLLLQPLYRYFPENNLLLLHAGLYPMWSLSEACALADEVSDFMRSNPKEFFSAMFGQESISWKEAKGRELRHRFIINAFTRMRYVDALGALDFCSHKPPPHPQKNLKPWYEYLPDDGLRIAFGHWSALGGYHPAKNIIALDGGCVWGNSLLAWSITYGTWYGVKCFRA